MMRCLKTIAVVFVLSLAALFPMACGKSPEATNSAPTTAPSGDGKLHIYTWSEYLPDDVVKDFTTQTGIPVTIDTYDSNEVLTSKLASGVVSYDLVVPSDYAIQPLIHDHLILAIDKSRLTNFGNLDKQFLDQRFDPGNQYSMPYLWGTTGLAYDKKKIIEPIDSWDPLFDAKYKGQILMLDDMRECFVVALKKLGKSVNETDPAVLRQAADLLKKQHDLVRTYDSMNYDNKLASGDVILAHGWNGQMAKVVAAKPDQFAYVLPKEGGTIWLDNVCIPTCARNVDAAYLFMNFILEPRISARIVNGVNYASPNAAARQFVDPKIINDKNIYPIPDMLKGWEFLDDVGGPTMRKMSQLWTEIKGQ
ncbi:MAG: spermidine/putrescine ABC transporter substrate-binding protein [Planctomycetota bacterium]|nr:spermidine/putrescine ABC transporter substrate-binding protein [Planctomycetota bacterium]